MPKHDLDWHEQDIADELLEYQEAKGLLATWSELSDIAYTYTRARWSGHTGITLPINRIKFYCGLLYMYPKYTLRWKFFRELGFSFNKSLTINEVRNPKKLGKLHTIAEKYSLDPDEFTRRAETLLKKRLLLK